MSWKVKRVNLPTLRTSAYDKRFEGVPFDRWYNPRFDLDDESMEIQFFATWGESEWENEFQLVAESFRINELAILPQKAGINIYEIANGERKHFVSEQNGKGLITDLYNQIYQIAGDELERKHKIWRDAIGE